MPQQPQHMSALDRANAVRIAGAELKREVRTGRVTIAAALLDERAGSLPVIDLLVCQHRWGRVRALKLLAAERIPETKRIRDLTDRQRRVIGAGLARTSLPIVALPGDQLILSVPHPASGVPQEGHAASSTAPPASGGARH